MKINTAACSLVALLASASAWAQKNAEAKTMSVAVMELRGSKDIPAGLVSTLTAVIPEQLDQMGPFRTISMDEVKQLLAHEALKQQMGCDEVSCLAEIGGALGTDYLVTGRLTRVDTTYILQMQVLDIVNAKVVGRASREYTGSTAGLVGEVRAATALMMRDILALNSGKLQLHISEEGATIKIDDRLVGVSPLDVQELAGGLHNLAVEKEGFVAFVRDITVVADQQQTVEVVLKPSEEFRQAYQQSAWMTRIASYASFGLGLAAIAGGGALYLYGSDQARQLADRTEAYNRSAQRSDEEYAQLQDLNRSVGTIDLLTLSSAGLGLAVLGAGVVLLLIGDDPGRYDAVE